MRSRIGVVIFVIGVVVMACDRTEPGNVDISPSQTASPITITVEVTNPPVPIQTPFRMVTLCVDADEPVFLMPSPSSISYPANPLDRGTQVIYKGIQAEGWYFVEYGDSVGWIHRFYLLECE